MPAGLCLRSAAVLHLLLALRVVHDLLAIPTSQGNKQSPFTLIQASDSQCWMAMRRSPSQTACRKDAGVLFSWQTIAESCHIVMPGTSVSIPCETHHCTPCLHFLDSPCMNECI